MQFQANQKSKNEKLFVLETDAQELKIPEKTLDIPILARRILFEIFPKINFTPKTCCHCRSLQRLEQKIKNNFCYIGINNYKIKNDDLEIFESFKN